MRPRMLLVTLSVLTSVQFHTYAQGRVGINTVDPLAGLHVQDSAVMFRGIFNAMSPGSPPVSGPGTRLMWYPGKAAFRAGYVSGTEWNRDSIGNYSIAVGQNVKAKGTGSAAFGGGISSGNYSFTGGSNTRASGSFSVAFGGGSQAQGTHSFAMGGISKALANYAFCGGLEVEAAGYASTAFGYYSVALGTSSFSAGFSTIAEGFGATAMGRFTHAVGGASAALGYYTKANGFASLAVGVFNDTIASGQTSISETTPLFIVGNGNSEAMRSNAFTVFKNGRVGIGDSSPDALTHIKSGTGGGQYHIDADLIIEDANAAYLQFSTPDAQLSGILSGNNADDIRSAILFRLDNGMDLRAGGNITRLRIGSDGDINMFDGEVHRTATAQANLLPISYGSVSSTGTILSGAGNFSVTNPSGGRYDVTITDEEYSTSDYTISVTPVATAARMLSTSATAGGVLIVRFYDSSGTLANTAFHFVVYKQ